MLINELPRYEILDEHSMQELDRGWRRIVSELGIDFGHRARRADGRARSRPRASRSRASSSSSTRTGSSSRSRRRRASSICRRATRERNIHIGGKHMAFGAVYGCPFVRRGLERREATYADFENLVRLAQAFPQLDTPGGTICEPNDKPLDSRHLDMVYALLTLSDKPFMGSVTSGPNARRHDRDGRDGVRPRVARADAGDHLADQRQLAAALRRPDAVGAARVRAREPGAGDHAVPADGRDVAGLGRGVARAAGGRGARRDRARADDPSRRARSCSARSSRTPTCSPARRASARPSRRSACSAPARSRATTACRSAAAAR